MSRRRVGVALVWWLLCLASTATAVERAPASQFFDQSFWDFTEELQNARDAGKQGILIMFEMDECPFCHRMKTTVLNRADVQNYFRDHFLIFAVDIEGDVEMTDFDGNLTTMKDFAFKQHRVRATPVFAFFDLEGEPMPRARYTGATRDAEEFLLLGRFVAEGHNQTTSFTRFKRSSKAGGNPG
ncbi:MAG: thioredoxin family protein [Gammaproteobacteria bacterium]